MALTPAQESFAQFVASGKNQSEAYRLAYPKSQSWKDSTVWSRASGLMRDSKVLARVEQIRAELADRGLWTREQSVKVLVDVAQAGERDADRIKAVAELNKMHGYHAPERHEHTGTAGGPLCVQYVEAGGGD